MKTLRRGRSCGSGRQFLALLFLLTAIATAGAQPLRLGDLDADGQPTIFDLVRLINHLSGVTPLPAALVPFADVNESGAITQADVDLIADAILGVAPLPDPYAPPVIAAPITAT